MSSLIEATGLVKRFGKVPALAGMDLMVPAGQITAVLGPNGAGKTTLIRTVATLLRPDAGTLTVRTYFRHCRSCAGASSPTPPWSPGVWRSRAPLVLS
jgi:ABC-type multidrug transport system ATPase subunit